MFVITNNDSVDRHTMRMTRCTSPYPRGAVSVWLRAMVKETTPRYGPMWIEKGLH